MLAHRGPDGEGLFVDEPLRVFLGHRRLVDPRHRRRAISRCGTRTGRSASSSTAKSTITPSCGRTSRRAVTSFAAITPIPKCSFTATRNGGAALPAAPQRHVRVRHLRSRPPTSVPRARSLRREAALLLPSEGLFRIRQRAERALPTSRPSTEISISAAPEVLRLRLYSGAERLVSQCAKAAGRLTRSSMTLNRGHRRRPRHIGASISNRTRALTDADEPALSRGTDQPSVRKPSGGASSATSRSGSSSVAASIRAPPWLWRPNIIRPARSRPSRSDSRSHRSTKRVLRRKCRRCSGPTIKSAIWISTRRAT